MPKNFIRNLVIAFVVVFVCTLLYHEVILGAQYHERLKAVSLVVDGKPVANMQGFVLSILMTALGYAFFVPVPAAAKPNYFVRGALMGMATLGTFTFLAHALVGGWGMWLTGSDFCFGLATGLIMGGVFTFTERKG